MSSKIQIVLLILLGIGAFVAASAIYTVSEVEQMIITQFGKSVGEPVTTAGLKIKVPFIQEVNLIDERVPEWDGSPSDMPTKDKLYISVDLFARWRITDPLQSYQAFIGENTTLILSTDSDLFKFLKGMSPDAAATGNRPR